jgi:hypothetical protein
MTEPPPERWSAISDNATLAFFTNPAYLNTLKRKHLVPEKDNTVDVKFYRKRIASLFKDLLKGDEVAHTMELKEIHTLFINTAIKYFQRTDTKDIIQGQYQEPGEEQDKDENKTPEDQLNPEELLNEIGDKSIFTVDEANDMMMRKTITVASLDNYVIFPPADHANNLRIIPLKMDIDLTSPELKTKGVKPKKKKKEEVL